MMACFVCHAQEHTFRARVMTADSTNTSIANCHIVNKTKQIGTVSDQYGNFRITAGINDSISFSAIGYEKSVIVLTDSIYHYNYFIKLEPKVYELEETTVKPLQLNLSPISKFEIPIKLLPNQGGVNIPTGISPVSFFYNRFSKEAKQKKYYTSVTEGTADHVVVGEKFNGEIVSTITGLKDDELIAFMAWCGFTQEFLRGVSPETIKREIRRKYKEYASNKEKSENH